MNKKFITKFLAIFITQFFLLINFNNIAIAADNDIVLLKDFSEEMTDKVRTILTDSSISQSNREAQIKEIFFKYMDSDWITRFTLGRYWRQLSPNKFKEFKDVYSTYLANNFVDILKKFTSSEFIIDSVNKSDSPGNYKIKSRIIINSSKNVTSQSNESNTLIVEYRVINKKIISGNNKISDTEDFVIYDMIVNGISMAATQRAEIGGQLSDANNIDQIINKLDEVNKNFARRR